MKNQIKLFGTYNSNQMLLYKLNSFKNFKSYFRMQTVTGSSNISQLILKWHS